MALVSLSGRIHRDIGRRTMVLNARPLTTDERDAPARIFLAMDDITEGKRLEALRLSEIRYRRLFEAAKAGLLIVDSRTHRITDANPFITELLGYKREEFLERELFEVGLFQNREACELAFRQLQEERVFRNDDLAVQTKVGELRTLEMAGNLYEEAGRHVIQCSIRDITERKLAEEERNQLLAREQAAREEAELANRAKDDFLATVSHELRTPLNPILGWSTLLRSRSLDDATSLRALESIERNAKSQAQLIEDILDVSRVITGKLALDVRPLDLTQVIDAAVDTIRPAAQAKTIQIQAHCDTAVCLVLGDPDRLQQVVWNLLSNAVKFTAYGGRVGIRLERIDSFYVQITVSDTGKGSVRTFCLSSLTVFGKPIVAARDNTVDSVWGWR